MRFGLSEIEVMCLSRDGPHGIFCYVLERVSLISHALKQFGDISDNRISLCRVYRLLHIQHFVHVINIYSNQFKFSPENFMHIRLFSTPTHVLKSEEALLGFN